MDSREIVPSIYKRNLREGKYIENISNPPEPSRTPRQTGK